MVTTRARVGWLCIGALLVTACGDDASGGGSMPDLRSDGDAALSSDLAAPDFTTPIAFCAGTALEGTCVQRFFSLVTACFPHQGSCTTQDHPQPFFKSFCWQDGSFLRYLTEAADGGATHELHAWDSSSPPNTVACFQADVTLASGGAIDSEVFYGDAMQLGYNPNTGVATCPDGSQETVGPLTACAELAAIVQPSCTPGTCPP